MGNKLIKPKEDQMINYKDLAQTDYRFIDDTTFDSATQLDKHNLIELESLVEVKYNDNGGTYFSAKTDKDYKFVRNEMKLLVIAAVNTDYSNWAGGLTDDEKKIACKHFLAPKSLRDAIYTDAEQESFGESFHNGSVMSRNKRAAKAVGKLYNRLNTADADIVIDDIEANKILKKYSEFGREGTIEGDAEGLFDYLEARTGTQFNTTGLKAKGWSPNGITLDALVSEVMEVMKFGNY